LLLNWKVLPIENQRGAWPLGFRARREIVPVAVQRPAIDVYGATGVRREVADPMDFVLWKHQARHTARPMQDLAGKAQPRVTGAGWIVDPLEALFLLFAAPEPEQPPGSVVVHRGAIAGRVDN